MRFAFNHSLFALLIATATGCWSAPHDAGLPVPQDFTAEAGEARDKQVPVLVLFMSEGCTYCETALEDFLLPMQRDSEFRGKVILRQIETDSGDALIDFEGNATTYKRFSARHGVSVVPNVTLFDSSGQVLTRIEGLLTADFYYGFLVQAIDESLEQIKSARH